jgi:2-dehydro-3-deoxyphosphogluconate aldolase/(4S)-4-hydroxy-2-oxoglutarate aldolase
VSTVTSLLLVFDAKLFHPGSNDAHEHINIRMALPITGISEELTKELINSKILFIPGIATPSDIILGLGMGLSFFKFFPANLFGGIPALKTYQFVFPNVSFCPTGGIDEESYLEYLELENVLSVGGSWMMI